MSDWPSNSALGHKVLDKGVSLYFMLDIDCARACLLVQLVRAGHDGLLCDLNSSSFSSSLFQKAREGILEIRLLGTDVFAESSPEF